MKLYLTPSVHAPLSPTEDECRKVREELYSFIDGELEIYRSRDEL